MWRDGGKVKDKRIEVVIKVEGEGGEVTVSTPLLCVFRAPQVNGEWNF